MSDFEPDPYRPITFRRRVLIALLSLATVSIGGWEMSSNARMLYALEQNPPETPACTTTQTGQCVGSITRVIAAPLSAPAPAATPAVPATLAAPTGR